MKVKIMEILGSLDMKEERIRIQVGTKQEL